MSVDISKIKKIKSKQLTSEQKKEVIQNLSLMNDKVLEIVFANEQNKSIMEDIANSLRKIHSLPSIPPIKSIIVQKSTIKGNIFGKKMVADITGKGVGIAIAFEAQKRKQIDFAVRGTISASNITRDGLLAGEKYELAPMAIGINIIDFLMPELSNAPSFCSRIVRANYDTGEHFLAEKYSEYYIELPKLPKDKNEVPKQYQELWEICLIFKSKLKEYKEVINMIEALSAKGLAEAAMIALEENPEVSEVYSDEELEELYYECIEFGKAQGVQEGFHQAKLALAKKLLDSGMPLEVVAELIELTLEEINAQ